MTKSYNTIDIAKFICSIGIIALHITPLHLSGFSSNIIGFLTSLCIPLFFVFSSYLFFNNNTDKIIKICHIWKFFLRIIKLYFIWFLINIIISPNNTVIDNFFVNIIWGNTYPGSWFYSALIISTLIVWLGTKYSTVVISLLSLVVYVYISMNYSGLINESFLFDWYQNNVYYCFLSFPYALVWTTLGLLISKKNLNNLLILNIVLILSLIVLYFFYDEKTSLIIPWILRFILVEVIVYLCINYNVNYSFPYRRLRNLSTLIFMIHFFFVFSLKDWFLYGINLKFIITVILTITIGCFVIKLSELKYFSFLKQLY